MLSCSSILNVLLAGPSSTLLCYLSIYCCSVCLNIYQH